MKIVFLCSTYFWEIRKEMTISKKQQDPSVCEMPFNLFSIHLNFFKALEHNGAVILWKGNI